MNKFFALLIFSIFLTFTVAAQNFGDRDNVIVLGRTGIDISPSYSIMVFESGEYIFTGRDLVINQGIFRGKFTGDEYKKAIDLMVIYRIKDFHAKYQIGSGACKEIWLDSGGVAIQVQHEGIRKTVIHSLGCRGFDRESSLIELENKLDEVFNTRLLMRGQ